MQTSLDMIQTVRLTASSRVTLERSYLYAVILTDDATGQADIALYDGANTSGDLLLDLQNLSTETLILKLDKPIVFNKGLYLSCGSNVKSVTLMFASIED